MKFRIDFYKDGQINTTLRLVSFRKALIHAAHELGKKLELLISEEKDVRVESTYLGPREWSAVIYLADDEIYGITIQKEK